MPHINNVANIAWPLVLTPSPLAIDANGNSIFVQVSVAKNGVVTYTPQPTVDSQTG